MIVCAHCTCMAGLGETCPHIAVVFFYLLDFKAQRLLQRVSAAGLYPPSTVSVYEEY